MFMVVVVICVAPTAAELATSTIAKRSRAPVWTQLTQMTHSWSVGDIPFGVHRVTAPKHTPPESPYGSSAHDLIIIDILAVVTTIKNAVADSTVSFEQLGTALDQITTQCNAAQREVAIESESHQATMSMLLQEMQEELSARDVFVARVVERMRATDGASSGQEELRKLSFLRAVSDATKIQNALDELSPSFVTRTNPVVSSSKKRGKQPVSQVATKSG